MDHREKPPQENKASSPELLYQVALTFVPMVGAVTARNLISYCGSARAVFNGKKKMLCKIPGIGESVAHSIMESKALNLAEKELKFMDTHGINALFYLDKDYPTRLKPFRDSPIMLYYKGNSDLNPVRTAAIIGTRSPSIYGAHCCEALVEELQRYNVTVISGLAFGIDVLAHRKSLEMGIPTIAALGHGLDRIYPSQHRSIAARMVDAGGLLSEYPSGTIPDREHFPMRNRIIAGMSDAIVVIESGESGGSIITAKMANNYNKDVFAYPGRVNDKMSLGCLHLIKTHQANLMVNAADLAYIMGWETGADGGRLQQPTLFEVLSAPEELIVNLLKKYGSLGIDRLTFECKISHSEMAARLLELEFKGFIRSLPGKRYISTT
jgi:DNA processing protein